ncbi:MAG: response regulator [Acidobacteriota bacterium]|nr:response regulator [Acidobacteriota bacterium]
MQKNRIAIVDDDESIRKTFFLLLIPKYNVYLARDAAEALARFKETEIDLIIADLRLPGENGLKMIQDFRQEGYKGKVVLISAFPEQIKADEIQKLNIDHIFIKPLDLKALTGAIDDLLGEPSSND